MWTEASINYNQSHTIMLSLWMQWPIRDIAETRYFVHLLHFSSETTQCRCAYKCKLKRSYDAILKIIILCIWCNRICWHASMFKKHIVFQILYIIVGPLCQASLKRIVFSKAPPSDKSSLLWLASWLCIVIGRTPQACIVNVTPLSIISSFSFQSKYKDS